MDDSKGAISAIGLGFALASAGIEELISSDEEYERLVSVASTNA